ncbi:DUF2141 domain-containing protein [Flavisphingomonas formosensis]|uniref:DUF2141 domain-containing protein n=1 Tax=Flavisphingomonas formosensis TaxID=861534 RepID=UPI0012FCFDCC|nr:DUF2141 domain-containing protein [Sphingomonas formosensis]
MIVALLPAAGAISAGPGEVQVHIEGLRSVSGLVSACLTTMPAGFPDCRNDPKSLRRSVKAQTGATIIFEGLAPGTYAVSLIHDENGNGKLDTRLGIPREGIGFSRNPVVRFSAPKFPDASFTVADKPVSLTVQMKYIL